MTLSSSVFTRIAHDLSKSKEAARAKKLVFYVSQRYWETDFNVINGYAWEQLLRSLYENNPTLEDLKALLYQAVNTLNRKAVYVQIAKYILKRMSSLYDTNSGQALESNNNSDVNQFDHELVDTIAENIQCHDESPRMRKLIFAVCKQYWENDIKVVEMYNLQELLLELIQLYPDTKKLKKALGNVVSTINRQNFYSFIADTIVDELDYLYQYENNSEPEDEGDETVLISAKKITPKPSSTPAPAKQKKPIDKSTYVSEPLSTEPSPPDDVGVNIVPEAQIVPWLQVDNLFDLKMKIMQYTNPLRAKIMLFYAIYQIKPIEQHWSIVRTCTLDDLLVRMFQHYGQNIDEIEADLNEIANSRIEGLDPEDNLQAVSAIVESIRQFYKKT